eukprot:COSAG06_NODE_26652_length_604_cov_0.444227_1_plen_76_part_10
MSASEHRIAGTDDKQHDIAAPPLSKENLLCALLAVPAEAQHVLQRHDTDGRQDKTEDKTRQDKTRQDKTVWVQPKW